MALYPSYLPNFLKPVAERFFPRYLSGGGSEASVTVIPEVVTIQSSIPTPNISGDCVIEPNELGVSVNVREPIVDTTCVVEPDVLVVSVDVQEPTITTEFDVIVTPQPVNIQSSVPNVTFVSGGVGGGFHAVYSSPVEIQRSFELKIIGLTITQGDDVTKIDVFKKEQKFTIPKYMPHIRLNEIEFESNG